MAHASTPHPPAGELRRHSGYNPPFMLWLVLLLAALAASSCVTLPDPEASQAYNHAVVAVFGGPSTGGVSTGQTLTARRSGLNGLTVWLSQAGVAYEEGDQAEDGAHPATITVKLYHGKEGLTEGEPVASDAQPVFSARYSASILAAAPSLHISLPPQANPPGQVYYLEMSAENGAFQAKGRQEDAYAGGRAYAARKPLDADLAFTLTYRYNLVEFDADLQAFFQNLWLAAPLGALLLLPGWLLLDLLRLRSRFNGGEQIAVSLGLSLAILPLIFLWTTSAGLSWDGRWMRFAAGALSAIALLRLWSLHTSRVKDTQARSERASQEETGGRTPETQLAFWMLAGTFILALALRLMMARDLATPAWVDSVHHGLIARLITENGAYPADYTPYMAVKAAQYHPGFHAGLVAFHWLSGLEIPQAMGIYGQVLNALAVYAAYLFTTTWVKDWRAGLAAAFITGLLTPMPAYYASWGRFTQLAGLIILPAALALLQSSFSPDRKGLHWRPALLAGLACAGLFLVHYRVTAFLAGLLAIAILAQLLLRREMLAGTLRQTALTWVIMTLAAALAALPWLAPTLEKAVIPGLQVVAPEGVKFFSDFSWRYLTAASGNIALGLALLGLAWSLARQRRFALAVALWVGWMFTLANLDALGLPGAGLVNNTTATISLFLPLSALGGFGLAGLSGVIQKRIPPAWLAAWHLLLALGIAAGATLAARQLLPILNPATALTRQADLAALKWVSENMPPGETFLVNPFLWGYGIYAGNDGGYWLSAVAGQRTIPPPVLYGLGDPQERQRIDRVCEEAYHNGGDARRIWELMTENDIGYVFLGVRGGPISAKALRESGLFQTIYSSDGVWIFTASR